MANLKVMKSALQQRLKVQKPVVQSSGEEPSDVQAAGGNRLVGQGKAFSPQGTGTVQDSSTTINPEKATGSQPLRANRAKLQGAVYYKKSVR